MAARRPTFRLYILGEVTGPAEIRTLTMLATFKDAQGVTTVHLDPSEVDELTDKIHDLRTFCEGGNASFEPPSLRELAWIIHERSLPLRKARTIGVGRGARKRDGAALW